MNAPAQGILLSANSDLSLLAYSDSIGLHIHEGLWLGFRLLLGVTEFLVRVRSNPLFLFLQLRLNIKHWGWLWLRFLGWFVCLVIWAFTFLLLFLYFVTGRQLCRLPSTQCSMNAPNILKLIVTMFKTTCILVWYPFGLFPALLSLLICWPKLCLHPPAWGEVLLGLIIFYLVWASLYNRPSLLLVIH